MHLLIWGMLVQNFILLHQTQVRKWLGQQWLHAIGPDITDPGWGNVHGNINLVTVQGNVNLVLGGPAQGIANLGWGSNPGTAWINPNINCSAIKWESTMGWPTQIRW
ncbi:UNVERIFIED_CONTAM: hypothetical protein Sradi_3141500 [Sesamum radiatum]|uniref:Uncharacterized protein n=1 Tax=Sesamum radiatum TaxID=300843 RepID=A0AAW2RDH8_SESRA